MKRIQSRDPNRYRGKIYQVGSIFETSRFNITTYVIVTKIYMESETYEVKVLFPQIQGSNFYFIFFSDVGVRYTTKPFC
jgi:hypothetical protein